MDTNIKEKIYKMLEDISDEATLNMVMEDVAFYTSKKDIVDELTTEQLQELDIAIQEANKGETISWDDFKKEMNGRKQK